MEIRQVTTRIRWALEEAAKGNVDALDQIHSANIVYHLYPFPDIKGLLMEKQNRLAAWKGFSEIHVDWEETISEGDTIAARYIVRARHTGANPQFPVRPTGKEVVLKGCFFLHQKNDRTVEAFEYDDWLGFLQQLGVLPLVGPE